MDHDDFAVEPVPGLPEQPPEGEHILWQGAPSWWALANEAFKMRWVAGYFVFLSAWRAIDVGVASGWLLPIQAAIPLLVVGFGACVLIAICAFIQARATMYTITNRRVAMRIGAALTVTLNLPYRWIASADLDLKRGGTGTIALSLLGSTKLSFLVCWPHVRPWAMRKTQPALRCIPDAAKVADILSEAAQTRVAESANERFAELAVAAE